ncbi:hypothetical protein ACFQ0K_17330 [Nocardioides caeni]|uniref:ABC transporter permease n=1 Tax=Nocardioides caeni TaxID=574700 RepID=A0A4S8NLL5_9ACTN|nr:hypothetical protein [Nocardioides caeni]THV15924.1 hypothetical protein E9934_06195 [Nocardioides caeni]
MNSFARLLRTELARLLHRRAILLLAAAAIIVPTIIGVVLVIDTLPPSDAEIAEAERNVELDIANGYVKDNIEECIADPQGWAGYPSDLSDAEVEERCLADFTPTVDQYLYSPQLDLANERDAGTGIAVTLIVAMAMMLLGTTFTGHDWASGSVSNQLLFETRRHRVWAAKAIVVSGFALVLAAVVLSTYWLVLGAVARSRDRLGDGVLMDCLQMGWRAALLAGIAALLGFALTMLFRSTVATLGILFGIALAGGILLAALGVEGRWNPAYNVAAVITDGTTYYAEVECSPKEIEEMGGDYGYCTEEREVTLAQGVGFLGTAVVAAGAVSLLSFRRRDVP